MALMSLVSHVPIGCSNQVSRVRSAVKDLAASEASGWSPCLLRNGTLMD